ncbi:MAG: hypothetical protein WAK01_09425 [Methylocystis sp.]
MAPTEAAVVSQPDVDRVRLRLERILMQMRAERKMAWDSAEQLLYQTIFPDMTHFLSDEEGARYRADFETEWRRLECA